MTSASKAPSALRTIGEVAEELDIATHVLRFWESKFHQIKPQKRRGRRYYRPEDIQTITKIKELLYGQGYTIRGVQKYLVSSSKNRMVAANESFPQEAVPETQATQLPAKPEQAFNTDLFGNIITDNKGDNAAEAVKTIVKTVVEVRGLSEEDKARLRQVHKGLSDLRDSLEDI